MLCERPKEYEVAREFGWAEKDWACWLFCRLSHIRKCAGQTNAFDRGHLCIVYGMAMRAEKKKQFRRDEKKSKIGDMHKTSLPLYMHYTIQNIDIGQYEKYCFSILSLKGLTRPSQCTIFKSSANHVDRTLLFILFSITYNGTRYTIYDIQDGLSALCFFLTYYPAVHTQSTNTAIVPFDPFVQAHVRDSLRAAMLLFHTHIPTNCPFFIVASLFLLRIRTVFPSLSTSYILIRLMNNKQSVRLGDAFSFHALSS